MHSFNVHSFFINSDFRDFMNEISVFYVSKGDFESNLHHCVCKRISPMDLDIDHLLNL